MRLQFLLVLLSATASAQPALTPAPPVKPGAKPKKRGSTMISVIHHVNNHCGGAAIPPGEDLYDQQYPASGATYFVRAGKKNANTKVIAQATSDDEGHLWFNLAKGTYCLISPLKRDLAPKKLKAEDLAPPGVAGPNPAGMPLPPDSYELSIEEKRTCDLVFKAPTTTGEVGIYSSSCPRLPPGASQPP